MKILIPMQSQKPLSLRIIEAYDAQSEQSEIVTIGVPHREQAAGHNKRFFEAKSRSFCSIIAKQIQDEFVCMSDSDCAPLVSTNLQEAIRLLTIDKKLGALAFPAYDINGSESDHVDIKSFVIRTELLTNLDWISPHKQPCLCYKVKEYLSSIGLIFRYIDTKRRIAVL